MNLHYQKDIQGLRAVAIILVVLAHAPLGIVSGGFIGVDVFFVISGYLITGLISREYQENQKIDLLDFYARRLKRLFPALLLMVVVVYVFSLWFLSVSEVTTQLASLPYAISWTSNLYFTFQTVDYFDELSTRDLFLHTWSLGVEEQFYLIWPILIIMLFSFANSFVRSGANKKIIFLFALLIISFIFSIITSVYFPKSHFYAMPSRIWQFALGGLIYFLHQQANIKSLFQEKEKLNVLLLFIGLMTLIIAGMTFSNNMLYPGFWAVIPSLAAALILFSGHFIRHSLNILAHPSLEWIGDRSYSWYLWHWPVFLLGSAMYPDNSVILAIFLIMLSFLLAMISYRLVEIPFWKGKLSHFPSRYIILVVLIIMAALIIAYQATKPRPADQEHLANVSYQWRVDVPIIYQMGCDTWYADDRVVPCVFQSPDHKAEKTAVLLGDSIGAQWFSMLPALFPAPDWRIMVFTKSSCPIVNREIFYSRINKMYDVCTRWRDQTILELQKIKPEIIVIGSAATYGDNEPFGQSFWVDGSQEIFEKLSPVTQQLIVIPGTPSLAFDGPSCIERHISDDGFIGFDQCRSKRKQSVEVVTNFLKQAAEPFNNVHVLDLNDLVCSETHCYAFNTDKVIIFRDSQHLTDSFVRSQVPVVRSRLEKMIPGYVQ